MFSYPSMEQFSDVVKEGLVAVKIKSILSTSRKSRWVTLTRQPSTGDCRLSFFEDPAGSRVVPPIHVVPLFQGDRAMIYSKKSKYGVLLSFRDGSSSFKFVTQSLYDAEVWMQTINETIAPQFSTLGRPTTPLPATPEPAGWSTLKKRQSAVFQVKVMQCPALPWRSIVQCRLEISAKDLTLLTFEDPAEVLVAWSIESILRFGQDQNCFVIETDSHSSFGEARIKFVSYEAPEIYQTFQDAALKLIRLKAGH